MKVMEKSRIRPEGNGPRIRCSTVDVLNFVPVSVAFVFDRTLDPAALARSLAATLQHYPEFAGSFTFDQGTWFLDCNGPGVQFEVVERGESLDQALRALPSTHRKHIVPDVALGLGHKKCLTHVRVSQFRDGGTVLGVSWHHTVGDWHSFMRFMRAWSDRAAGRPPEPALFVADRDQFTASRSEEPCDSSGLRLVGYGELAGMALRLIAGKHRHKVTVFHFTEDEIAGIRAHLQHHSELRLSANDALTSHLMTTINEVEPRAEPRKVTLAVNFRRRLGVPDDAVGNFIGLLTLPCEREATPVRFAERLRRAIDSYDPRYRGMTRFISENGGSSRTYRFMPDDIDVIDGTALSNFNRFGLFELTFGGGAPSLFVPVGVSSFPWYGIVSEGYGNRGTQLAFNMPGTVAERLRQPEIQAKLHRFRSASAELPPAERMPWLA